MRRAKEGDRDAFRGLYELYHQRLFGTALTVLKNREDALDIVQEAFVKAYRNLPRFEGTSGFYTWIYRITMNAAIDHLRKKNRAPSAEFEEGRGDHEGAIAEPGPSLGVNAFEGAHRRELREAIKRALDQLPEHHRMAVILRDLEGYSYEEIAETLEIPRGTVMSRLFHARRSMQVALRDYFDRKDDEDAS